MSSAVQSNGIWISPQFMPFALSPPGAMLA
ncbi:Uncharacterised protein [Mycobacteroides abscessus]|nr:Uncharacterised protein [Mycobacteroides abscessus]